MEVKTLKFRLKDKHAKWLGDLAKSVNFVWNAGQEHALNVLERERRFVSGFDLNNWAAGASKAGLQLPGHCVQQVLEEYATRRRQFKRRKLKWRKSFGAKRNLGWVPFKVGQIVFRNGQLKFAGKFLSLWDSFGLAQYKNCLRAGSFSEDSLGRWYLNIAVRFEPVPNGATAAIGIDLGLKDIATPSSGEPLEAGHWTRAWEGKLVIAQRTKNKARTRAIHAKIKSQRKDTLHKFSSKLVKENATIFVGDVSPLKLAKTRMAKSVLDSGWGMLKQFCEYKIHWAGTVFEIVDERNTTLKCSNCGRHSGPRGLKCLGIREWVCMGCGTAHDRDVNAARNILAAGHRRLSGGIPFL
jgi:putative transposase